MQFTDTFNRKFFMVFAALTFTMIPVVFFYFPEVSPIIPYPGYPCANALKDERIKS
jgi:hypothetical protein